MSTTAYPALISAYMQASAGRRNSGNRIGPFTAGLDAHSDNPFRNFAVPDDGAAPDDGQVGALVAYFQRNQRIPRLEYIEDSAPRVLPALIAAGFAVERRTPVMIATAQTVLTPRSPTGITVRQAVGDTDLAASVGVQHYAYEVPDPPGPDDIARITGMTRRGGIVVVAVDDDSGTVVGTGLVDVAADYPGVGELAAVGVLTGYRRRGIASAVSVCLARTAHAQGIGLVFLEAEPDEEQIYRRAGFFDVTAKIWVSSIPQSGVLN
jgi:ribosomal protein S18 acetylase RimI-like enzyme